MTAKQSCSEKVFRDWHYYQCQKTATVERDGRHYCGTHDPVAVKAKDEARSEKYRREREEAAAKHRLESAAPELLEALQLFIQHDEIDHNDGVAMMLKYAEALEAGRAAIAKALGGS